MDKELERKEKKKLANKAYYDKIKAKITALDAPNWRRPSGDNIKNNTEETETKEQDNFFFQKPQKKEPPLPEVKPPPQIIVQAPPPVKVSLKSRILETTILSMIPIIPMLIKQFMIILQARQDKQQKPTQEESATHLNMQYQQVNSYDF